MDRGKQSIKKGVWYIGGKRKKKKKKTQKGGAIPFGLIASLAAPVYGEIAKPVFKTIIGRGIPKKKVKRNTSQILPSPHGEYNNISNDIESWYDTSIYDENNKRPLPIGKNKKGIGLFKDDLGERIMKELCAIRTKTYSHLMNDDSEVKKSKGSKKCLIKWEMMFKNDTDCLLNDKVILKLQ